MFFKTGTVTNFVTIFNLTLVIANNYSTSATSIASSLQHSLGRPLIVSSILIEPYLMLNVEYNSSDYSNSRFTGYIADLVHKLSQIIGFAYIIRPVEDGSYGYRRPDGSWDGIIGEIMKGRATLGAAPTYITKQRLKVIDFTDVFMPVSATMLLKKHSMSTTIVTAAGAGRQTVRSVKELLNRSDIKYGILNKGVLVKAFKKSNVSIYQMLWKRMLRFEPSVFTQSNEEGIERLRRDSNRYVYILPHTIGEYVVLREPCDLMTVGRFLMHRGYAIAIKKRSPLKQYVNSALRTLRISGYLDGLYRKWWQDRSDCNGLMRPLQPHTKSNNRVYSIKYRAIDWFESNERDIAMSFIAGQDAINALQLACATLSMFAAALPRSTV